MQDHVADSKSCLSITRWASEELSEMTFSLRFKPTSAGFYLFDERNDDSFDGSDLSFDDDEHKSDISSLTLDDSLSLLSSFEDIHSCSDSLLPKRYKSLNVISADHPIKRLALFLLQRPHYTAAII